jgi:beta-galactosidase
MTGATQAIVCRAAPKQIHTMPKASRERELADAVFRFGVDYYPEQWPETRWETDARLMREAGFNVVRLAEFAWSRLEPREDQFDFAWLDRAIDLLHAHGMDVVLGTPTASPPVWVMRKHPDAYRVLEDGRRLTFGNRRHYCPNHPGFRERTCAIVTAMAQHYAGHPAVIGWQIDNEFGDRCYCESCAGAFGNWLAGRYGTIQALNERWGTAFWSQEYADWNEVPLPLRIARAPNPGLHLDYFRFASDSYVDYQDLQIDILRRICPGQFITHNLMGFKYEQLNYFDLAKALDFVTWDNYPRHHRTPEIEPDPAVLAINHDTMRGLKRQNFWVMEEQAGPAGWENVSTSPRPGEIRLWSWQAIAHGADGIVFFRWRTARFATEQYWHGILEHHGDVGRRYAEVKRMGAEVARIGAEVLSTNPHAEVGLVLSYDSRFAFQAQGNSSFSYPGHLAALYAAFHRRNVPVEVVAPDADLTAFKVVLAPALHVLPPEVAAQLRDFVSRGGILLSTARTGVKGTDNEVVELHLPGLLRDVFGIRVEEYDARPSGAENTLQSAKANAIADPAPVATAWCDVLEPEGAEPLFVYTEDSYAGMAAVTANRFGRGLAVYSGTFGNAALMDELATHLLEAAGIASMPQPDGIEVCPRTGDGGRELLFVLNHASEPRRAMLPEGNFIDLLSGASANGSVDLLARDVCVLRRAD